MFKDATRAVRLVAAAMREASLDTTRMAERAGHGWITVTELADTLARDRHVPFRVAHTIATRFVAACTTRAGEPRAAVLAEVSQAELGERLEFSDEELSRILSPRHFVEVRKTPGGPSPEVTAEAVRASELVLARDEQWLADSCAQLKAAAEARRAAAAAL
jgi:argininosuccinate lyase